MVEDSPSGVAAAVAAGTFAIGYTAGSDELALTDAGAQIVIASMRDLPARAVVFPAAMRCDRIVEVGAYAFEAVDVPAGAGRSLRQLAEVVVVAVGDAL